MSYDKNTWQTGDVITANKLNHIEDGIAGAGGGGASNLYITLSSIDGSMDKTWQEIWDTMTGGGLCFTLAENVGQDNFGFEYYVYGVNGDPSYEVIAYDPIHNEVVNFTADSADGYPVMDE